MRCVMMLYRYVGPIGSVRFYRCVIRCGCVIFYVTTQSYMSNVACRTAVPVMHDANSGLGPNCVRTYGVRQRYPTNRSTNNQYTQPQSIDAIPVLLELWSTVVAHGDLTIYSTDPNTFLPADRRKKQSNCIHDAKISVSHCRLGPMGVQHHHDDTSTS